MLWCPASLLLRVKNLCLTAIHSCYISFFLHKDCLLPPTFSTYKGRNFSNRLFCNTKQLSFYMFLLESDSSGRNQWISSTSLLPWRRFLKRCCSSLQLYMIPHPCCSIMRCQDILSLSYYIFIYEIVGNDRVCVSLATVVCIWQKRNA